MKVKLILFPQTKKGHFLNKSFANVKTISTFARTKKDTFF